MGGQLLFANRECVCCAAIKQRMTTIWRVISKGRNTAYIPHYSLFFCLGTSTCTCSRLVTSWKPREDPDNSFGSFVLRFIILPAWMYRGVCSHACRIPVKLCHGLTPPTLRQCLFDDTLPLWDLSPRECVSLRLCCSEPVCECMKSWCLHSIHAALLELWTNFLPRALFFFLSLSLISWGS